jgi:hypothetical protein
LPQDLLGKIIQRKKMNDKRKYRIEIALTTVLVVFILWLAINGFGQALHVDMIQSEADIAVWNKNIFLIEGGILKKLDFQLNVVKTVRFTSGQPFLPTEPNSNNLNTLSDSSENKQTDDASTTGSGRITADQQFVYVIYQGRIFIFDHNLIQIKSKILN